MSKTTNKYSPEVRERAVRMLLEYESQHESRWAAMVSIAGKIGCNPETLRGWVRHADAAKKNRCENRGPHARTSPGAGTGRIGEASP